MPLLSIIIPTRNRPITTISAVKTVLDQIKSNVEIIVHDCGVENDIEEEIEKIADARVCYYKTLPCSMTENWNQAIDKAHGEFVTVVGDDDGVTRALYWAAEWAHRNNIDAVLWNLKRFPAEYYWPDYPDSKRESNLYISDYTCSVKTFDPRENEISFVRDIRCTQLHLMPTIYNNLVSKNVISSVKVQATQFFTGICVDHGSRIAMLPYIKKMAIVDFPIVISGHCGKSNSGRAKNPELQVKKHVSEYSVQELPDTFPFKEIDKFVNYYIILAADMYNTLLANNNQKALQMFNYEHVYAIALLTRQNLSSFKLVVQRFFSLKKMGIKTSPILLAYYLLFEVLFRLRYKKPIQKARELFQKKRNHSIKCDSIFDASTIIMHDTIKTKILQENFLNYQPARLRCKQI